MDEIGQRSHVVALQRFDQPRPAGDAVRRSRPAPIVDPGQKAFGVPLRGRLYGGGKVRLRQPRCRRGAAGRHQLHRSRLSGRCRPAPVDGSRRSGPHRYQSRGILHPLDAMGVVLVTSAYRRFSALWSTTRGVLTDRNMEHYGAGLAEYRVLSVIASRY
jgi:hypothetical protein